MSVSFFSFMKSPLMNSNPLNLLSFVGPGGIIRKFCDHHYISTLQDNFKVSTRLLTVNFMQNTINIIKQFLSNFIYQYVLIASFPL